VALFLPLQQSSFSAGATVAGAAAQHSSAIHVSCQSGSVKSTDCPVDEMFSINRRYRLAPMSASLVRAENLAEFVAEHYRVRQNSKQPQQDEITKSKVQQGFTELKQCRRL
jgi:hypothetical protein